ncbi:eIF2A-related protein [Xylanibacter muris]|uniref:TIR domain-containing protein n=1 Tax=Xylanibacter muris TaxID=2736290 RepID=A0ABX2AMC0_9BACT|nr:TIR domain-containing protein [Xylanibacter muris]NPD91379.1 TIR domain-containing protein [Xylanibacter muris]
MTKTYLAFISYSHKDKEHAKWLHEKLESFRVPVYLQEKRPDLPEYVRPIFRDETDLELGVLTDNIHHALENSQFLIVICSPNSRTSKYVNDEINFFSKVSISNNNRILPFIVAGEPNSENECFPDALKKKTELLAANINELGRDYASVKIIAKMLDLKIDDLWQRYCIMEEKEKQRIKEERDKLLAVQSRYIAKEAIVLAEEGDPSGGIGNECLRALALVSEVYPKNISTPERPFTHEAYDALRFLNKKSEQLERVLTRHTYLRDIQISPDGKFIASIILGMPYVVDIWEVETGKIIKTLEGHSGIIHSVVFSPDGERIVTTSEDKTIRIWDTKNGECINVLEGHKSDVLSCQFCPNGKVIITRSQDNTVGIWDLENGTKGFYEEVSDIQFSQDKKKMAIAAENEVSVIDMDNNKYICSIEVSDIVFFCCFNSDGNHIVTATRDNIISIWDLKGGTRISAYKAYLLDKRKREYHWVQDETYTISKYIRLSPDRKTIAFRYNRERAAILNLDDGECISILDGQTKLLSSLQYSFDGKFVISSSWDNTVRIWDANSGKSMQVIPLCTGLPHNSFYNPDGKHIIVSSDNNIGIYSTEVHEHINICLEKGLWVNSIHLSPDNKSIIIVPPYGLTRIWDIETKKWSKTLNEGLEDVDVAHYSPNGMFIAMALRDHTIRVLDANSHKCIAVLKGYANKVNSLHFSPDGKCVVAAIGWPYETAGNIALVWDIKSERIVATLDGHTHSVTAAQFCPDGEYIVTASEDKTVCLWDAKSGNCIKTFKGHTDIVCSANFSPDGKHIVTSSRDNTVRIWDVNSGRCIKSLDGHTSWVQSAMFSSNGKRIVTTSKDFSVRVWNTEDGQCISIFKFEFDASSVQFCFDNEHIVVTNNDILRILHIPDQQNLIDETLKKLNGYKLSKEDRKTYYLE